MQQYSAFSLQYSLLSLVHDGPAMVVWSVSSRKNFLKTLMFVRRLWRTHGPCRSCKWTALTLQKPPQWEQFKGPGSKRAQRQTITDEDGAGFEPATLRSCSNLLSLPERQLPQCCACDACDAVTQPAILALGVLAARQRQKTCRRLLVLANGGAIWVSACGWSASTGDQ